METRTARQIWDAALGELQVQVSRPNFRTWFEKTEGSSYEDGNLVVSVPNIFIAEYLDRNQRALIEKTLMNVCGSADIKVSFQVSGRAGAPARGGATKLEIVPAASNLNPNYVFKNFIVGKNNRIAYEAALEVLKGSGRECNPLFICGGVGLGKTHLLHAIGHEAIANRMMVQCVSAEQFTNEFVSSVREHRTEEFRNRFRNLDMLLIDEISFISGKQQTEECFFHTFNDLHNAHRQIVITSNQSPKDIPLIEERLRSRLEWGLVADIQPPDIETRLAILKAKAEQRGADINNDVLELIAQQIKQNIRELEGSLNRVIAFARLMRSAPTVDMAHEALKNLNTKELKPAQPATPIVLKAVAESFNLTPDDITGTRRDKDATLARRVAMYFMRQETNCSVTQIGQEMGGRDPSAVTHACKKLEAELESNHFLQRKVQEIQKSIKK